MNRPQTITQPVQQTPPPAGFLPPPALTRAFIDISVKKGTAGALNLLILGILAGVFIGFAAHVATTVATGAWPGFFGLKKFFIGGVFSCGLMMVMIPGSELWTGNNLMVVGLLEKRISFGQMMRNWILVYGGNLIGSIFLAWMIAAMSGLHDGAVGGTALKIAYGKVASQPAGLSHNVAYFFRAICCNWMVCLAVMMAVAAKDIAGKVLAIFFPIMAFVTSGFEHAIANMYFIPAGIFAKNFDAAVKASGIAPEKLAALNWSNMWTHNLITVTLGNLVGGAILCGVVYWWLYARGNKGN
ncbi:MAG: formate/nitrite transporter family protein [Lentisphaerae bacterium]|nr:MAG: formate/nitrite transporter family protein [Lentisphaerota bacterium]